MKRTLSASGNIAQQQSRSLKNISAIVAILGGLALCAYFNRQAIFFAVAKWISDNNISTAEQNGVDYLVAHAYPGSTVVRADASVGSWPTGDNASVEIEVTFDATPSFGTIRNWYVQHPDGGWDRGHALENTFPREGLDKLDGDFSGKTRYRVAYVEAAECIADCDRPSQQIR